MIQHYESGGSLAECVRRAAERAERVTCQSPTIKVAPKVVNQIFEDLFLCERYKDDELVVSHDNIIKIRDKYRRKLNL